jgi:hypothetical protein
MTLEKITAFHHARPFRPFELHLADGRALPVAHPEVLVLGGRTCTIYGEPDVGEVVDLLLVVSLRPVLRTRRPHASEN